MYQKLKTYRVWHGDCNVPGRRYQPDPSLGIWVESQRRKYRQGKLSPDHIEQLEELGFTWSLRWDKDFERLQAFKAKFGHVNFNGRKFLLLLVQKIWCYLLFVLVKVSPSSSAKNRIVCSSPRHIVCPAHKNTDHEKLADWVTEQRAMYFAGKLPADRMAKLGALGLDFCLKEGFSQFFNNLKAYKEKHGHTNVPNRSKDYPTLARQVNGKRQ